MSSVFVIHSAEDQAFVEGRLIRPLPALGFEQWYSSVRLDAGNAGKTSPAAAMKKSAAILAVVSSSAALEAHRTLLTQARRTRRPVVVIRVGEISLSAADGVWSMLPAVTVTENDEQLWHDLTAVLPKAEASSRRSTGGTAIVWDPAVFSGFLREAVDRHDYHRGDALLSALARHLKAHPGPYPPEAAAADLNELRKKRQFSLMCRYGEAALKSGVIDFEVRRLYAQSLIELGKFPQALKVLKKVVEEAPATHVESYEARGLIGRVYKQRYVNAPNTPRARVWLSHAIKSYKSVYEEDPEQVWHGINAASLLLRASRDGQGPKEPRAAREIARQVVATLDSRSRALGKDPQLSAFDCASLVEAFVDLDEFAVAQRALDVYLAHPAMHAFEVSSTYRQFDEVLQLGEVSEGRAIVDRLWQAVERHRAGGLTPAAPVPAARARSADESDTLQVRPMLLRVSDPGWVPGAVPDLTIQVRLGTVLSITGSEATIRSLMKDSSVIAVEDSRPTSQIECADSVPFINVRKEYTGLGGTFSEKGDGALIAVIDDGIDVLHRAFQDDTGTTRILGLWDQRDKTGPPPDGFDLGTFHTHETIQKWVADNSDPNAATFTVPAALTRNVDGHGTHVASIAAGRAVGQFAGGVAPEAKILVVVTAATEAIGYSNAHLAALKFINQFATKAKLPVVINLSQGMNAGAHDGRSALEVGFDEFSGGGRAPGRIVVKSAGNERGKNGHAKVELLTDTSETLTWHSWTDPAWNRDRVELWWDSINSFRFRLTAPSGQQSDWVDDASPTQKGRLSGGGPFRMELVKRHPDNGDSRLVVDLGTGPGLNLLAEGDWILEMEAVTVRTKGEIHAWLEKGGSRPSEFVNHCNEEMTLSVPGTAFSVIAVGAVGSSKPLKVGPFSSYGPTRDRRNKPDVVAPGVNVKAARGGTFEDIRPESGTSMAAPHVTGAIALLLSRAAKSGQVIPSASQAGAKLRQMAGNATGSFTSSMGFGLVDVGALLTAV